MRIKQFAFIVLMSVFCLLLGAYPLAQKKIDSGDKIISLDFKKISVRELLQFVAEAMNYNIILSENVSGFVSLHFKNMTWDQLLDSILEMTGLVTEFKNNTLFIATANEFALRQKIRNEAYPMKILEIKMQHVDVCDIEPILRSQTELLTPNAKVSINSQENSIWVKENAGNITRLINFLHNIDHPNKQIYIAAKIINIDDNKLRELGINFKENSKSPALNEMKLSLPQIGTKSLQVAIINMAQDQLLRLQLDAWELAGYSKIIADPKLVTQNRKLATIEAGEEIPYQESTSSGATSLNFKKAALSLKVKPTLLPDGRIILALEIDQNKISALAVNGTPGVQTQELKTEVIVRSEQTVILGGIVEKTALVVTKRVPIVGNLPVVGHLFSHEEKNKKFKQLLVFITPKIITEE